MINKLLSNISFNPSLVEQIGFYTKRLRREESVRRLGLIMIILSMLVQVFAVNFPAEKSLAYSDNHIINGVKTRGDILRAWDAPRSDVAEIYGKFGVTRQDIANLPNKPNSTVRSNAENFWSIGRNSLTGYSNISSGYKDKEIALRAGGSTIYLRPLRAWDSGGHSTYSAFKGRSSITGETFWILVDCGNYTQIGKGRPPKPELQVKKSIAGNPKRVKPGQKIKFRVQFRNKKQDSLAEDVVMIDKVNRSKYEVLNHKNLPIGRDGRIKKDIGNLKHTDHSRVFVLEVRIKNNVKDGDKICNRVTLNASNTTSVSDEVCTRVKITPEPPTPPPPIPPDDVPPALSKEVTNLTQNVSGGGAIETKIQPGDLIEYRLITTNTNDESLDNFVVSDYVGDLLDYATLDTGFLKAQGGVYDESTKKVVWTNVALQGNSETVHRFRIQIKDPIPSTNSPSSVTTNFDCKISNEYGDEISMNVACPLIKNVETLPNTGPGETIAFAFATASVSGYFFARTRLLAKELAIAKRIFPSAGGTL